MKQAEPAHEVQIAIKATRKKIAWLECVRCPFPILQLNELVIRFVNNTVGTRRSRTDAQDRVADRLVARLSRQTIA
jgi:hypothetical protein